MLDRVKMLSARVTKLKAEKDRMQGQLEVTAKTAKAALEALKEQGVNNIEEAMALKGKLEITIDKLCKISEDGVSELERIIDA